MTEPIPPEALAETYLLTKYTLADIEREIDAYQGLTDEEQRWLVARVKQLQNAYEHCADDLETK